MQMKKIEKLRGRVLELLANQDFAAIYLEGSRRHLSDESDRPFGVGDIGLLSLYHLVQGYGHLWNGNEEDGQDEVALSAGYLVLSAEIFFADRRHLIATEGRSLAMGWDVLLLGFARLISYGNHAAADWWARQLVDMLPAEADFLESALPDDDLARHLILLGRCWTEQRWANTDESQGLGVYRQLWAAASDTEFEAAIQECLDHRFKRALGKNLSAFALPANSVYPLELLATISFYKKLVSPDFQSADLFLSSDLSRALRQLDCRDDDLIHELRRRAEKFYGRNWSGCPQ
jgi:hypothetical protein